jgi:hypothetical protein
MPGPPEGSPAAPPERRPAAHRPAPGPGAAAAGSPCSGPRPNRQPGRRPVRSAPAASRPPPGRGAPRAIDARRAVHPGRMRQSPRSGASGAGRGASTTAGRGRAQADSSLRPLRRRAARIARPARVCIRTRKPCVLARRRLFGWNVRLLTRELQNRRAHMVRGDTSHHRTFTRVRGHTTGAAIRLTHGTAPATSGSNRAGASCEREPDTWPTRYGPLLPVSREVRHAGWSRRTQRGTSSCTVCGQRCGPRVEAWRGMRLHGGGRCDHAG